jgi:hypothetical protein
MKIRWIIYILIALAVIVPMLARIYFPVERVSESTKMVYRYIEDLPEGSVVALVFDYGPSTVPELQPAAEALLRHCFRRNIKVIGLTLWPTGTPLGRRAFELVGEEMGKTYGEDFVYLGYRAGGETVMLQMGEEIGKVFEVDYKKRPISQFPLMQKVRSYKDIDLLVDLAAGATVEGWITYAYTKFDQKLAAAVTMVIVSQLYPYVQAEQLVGVIPGMLGAAEYEKLIERPALGMIGLSIQSIVHILVILLVVIGNIEFMLARKEG